ncbi:MAG: PilZ domain-containing protein [Candidatus Omnitrophota bacterium]|nr:PilZ domain-containing protein [Candidatus Omnitrophota bacterium]
MRASDFVEKRRTKRLDLSLPMMLRRITGEGKEEAVEAVTSNVSYNGAYVRDVDVKNISQDDNLHISLSVPRDDSRDFPFSRISGTARVVRVDRGACALEFGEGVSRLFVAN